MAILGLLLFAAATVAGVEMSLSNRADVGFEVFGTSFTAPMAVVFLLGGLLMTVAIFGLFLVTGAAQRARRVRHDARHRSRTTEERAETTERTVAELVAENDSLRAELEAQRRAVITMGGITVPPGAGTPPYGDQVSDAVRSETIERTGHFPPYPEDSIDLTDRAEAEEKADVVGRFRDRR